MNASRLLDNFDRISEAPDAVPRLRRFVLDLAVRGKLADQDPRDEPAEVTATAGVDKAEKLPESWVAARVGDLLRFQYGKGLGKSKRLDVGPIPVFGSNGITGYSMEALTEVPAIIVGRKGSAGALNLCDGPSWTTDVAYFVTPPPFFAIRYLLIALRTLELDTLGKGVKPGLSRNEAYDLTICVPPLAEQHRIIAKVDELLAICDRLESTQSERETQRDRLVASSLDRLNETRSVEVLRERVGFHLTHLESVTTRPDQMAALRETVLNLAVLGHLTNQDDEEENASALLDRVRAMKSAPATRGRKLQQATTPDTSQKGGLPDGWTSVQMGDLCSIVTSGSRGWAAFYSKVGPKFIRAQNIRFGRLRLDDLACVTPPAGTEGARTQVSKGDLLVVITGAGVTNPALLDRDLGEAYVSQHVGLVRPAMTELSKWLLLCLMAHAGGRSQLLQRAYGAGKPGLNLDNIRTLIIPLPPMEEQLRILAKVDELVSICDMLESALEVRRACDVRLLDAVLHEALTVDLPQADRVRASLTFATIVELKQDRRSASSDRQTKTVPVPHLGTIAAGVLTFAEQRIEDWFHIPKVLMKAADDDWCVLRVSGNSMNLAEVDHKLIEDGDFLLVRRQDAPEAGKIVVAEFEGETVLKRFVKNAGAAVLRAESTDTHSDIPVEPGFRIQGVVRANLKSGTEFERTDERGA